MFARLGSLADRRARWVAAAAGAFFVLAALIGGSVADELEPYGVDDPATESVIAQERLERAGFRDTSVVVLIEQDVTSAAGRARVAELTRRLERDPEVSSVSGFLDTGSRDFVAEDSSSTYLAVSLRPTEDKPRQEASDQIADELLAGEPDVSLGGPALIESQINEQTEDDLQRAEMFAFPFIFLLTFLFFRSLVAAALPVMVGALAIVGTFLLLRIAAELGSISIFALNLTTGLGLGLSIDYSLFVVSRYREEIAKSGPGPAAIRRTMETAGRTVLFSALTVAAALASLTVFPQRFLYSMGLGGALVALLAAAISLLVLPSILVLLGHRVNALAPRALQRRAERESAEVTDGFWYRLSRLIQRRPLPIATISAVVLIAMGIPFLEVRFTSVDGQTLPPERSARQVDDVLRAEFPPHRDTPIRAVLTGGDPGAARDLRRRLRSVDGITQVRRPQVAPDGTVVVDAIGDSDYYTPRGRRTVAAARALPDPAGAEVGIAGAAAGFVDYRSSLADHLPIALAIVVLATLVVLFVMTGSVTLPFMQLALNFLNLCAVFGLLVFVFQDGRLEGALAYTSPGALDQTMPLILFAMAFGLSTDYGVFLLARVKEARDGGAGDSDAIAIGLERTGRIVTAAALLFALAVGVFATSKMIFIKQNFTGVAAAVLLDATIIRALLVPSLMEMIGRWSWWAPRPLRRLHSRIGLSEGAPEPEATPAGSGE